MSDPFLPVPPEEAADRAAARERDDLEDDRGPDVLPPAAEHDADEVAGAGRAARPPDRFRTPRPGEALSAEQLEDDLG